MTRIYALSAVEAGFALVRALASRGVALAGIIALSQNQGRSAVSGFMPAGEVFGLPDVPVIEVDDYRLLAEADRNRVSALGIDILIVAGWQRLVPEWLIRNCRKGVIGLHGSAGGINAGRGRSPQNWALLLGASGFELAAFQIDAGVDSGPILSVRRFDYTPHDDIASSYAKSMLVGADMIAEIATDWDGAVSRAKWQDESAAGYLPQRRPEDGVIDWRQPSERVRAQVAALTRPYPGAYCDAGGSRMTVWSARPIGDIPLREPGVPGQVVYTAGKSAIVVRTGDGYVYVDDFTVVPPADLSTGTVLASEPLARTIDRIATRHAERFPQQTLSQDIARFVEAVR